MVVGGRAGTTAGRLMAAFAVLALGWIGLGFVFGLLDDAATVELVIMAGWQVGTVLVGVVAAGFFGGNLPAATGTRAALNALLPWRSSGYDGNIVALVIEIVGIGLIVPGLVAIVLLFPWRTRYDPVSVGVRLGFPQEFVATVGLLGLGATTLGMGCYVGSWIIDSLSPG